MPSQPYDLVQDDQDIRIPLHAEQAFERGIRFQAKLIGAQEVTRPNSRTEIVQAMRRIRYESKVQNLKKKKVIIDISVSGVKVCLKKKRRKKKQQWESDPNEIELMNHPIYRIFYVSHDSSDLKIFSYIARDGSSNTFKCAVFKSTKKSQAMRIVRTVGQAFEVCHKLSINQNNSLDQDDRSDTPCDTSEHDRCSEPLTDDDEPKKDPLPLTPELPLTRPNHLDIFSMTNNTPSMKSLSANSDKSPTTPLSTSREIQLLREQLEQQSIQTRQALAQLMMVREQLISETNARIEAQSRTQQLLQQNRELLEHIASLGSYNEPDRPGLNAASMGIAPQSSLSMYLQEQADLGLPMRKAFSQTSTPNNYGTIGHQLSALNKQLGGYQQAGLAPGMGGNFALQNTLTSLSQLQNINQTMNNLSQNSDLKTQQELYQINQELLNRLQNLNFGYSPNNNSSGNNNMFANPNSPFGSNTSSSNTNTNINNNNNNNNNNQSNNSLNNNNMLHSPASMGGNLTPSPIGTLNRSPYSMSPLDDTSLAFSMDKSLDSLYDSSLFIKPLSQVTTLTTLDTDGKVKVIVPVSSSNNNNLSPDTSRNRRQQSVTTPVMKRQQDKKVSLPGHVTLRVTDECGNVTNTRKLPATPAFITRSTSEKVPNRSQMMSQVQRTQWARHTTK